MTMTDIVMGPWLRNMLKIQPTKGRSVSASGGVYGVNLPAESGAVRLMMMMR